MVIYAISNPNVINVCSKNSLSNVQEIKNSRPDCPTRDDYKELTASLLLTNVAGQDEAIQRVIMAILSHDNTKPLIFHFTG